MGATMITKIAPIEIKTKRQLNSFYRELKKKTLNKYKKDKEYWDYIMQNSGGHSTDYTGDWATFEGYSLNFAVGIVESKKLAVERIEIISEKWYAPIAIKYREGKKTRWLIGGWAAE